MSVATRLYLSAAQRGNIAREHVFYGAGLPVGGDCAEGCRGQGGRVDSLYLARNGVPFDVAFSLDAAKRTAWIVVLGELEGMAWDWGAMRWTG